MSGPMSLEPGGAEQDTLALRLARPRPPRRRPRWALDDTTLAVRLPRRGPDEEAVSALAAELADRVGPAVHPYEVAALLEAEGLSAATVSERYGHPNLFSLASALYERVPRTFPDPPAAADPWRPDTVRCLLRGLLFALPALAYPLTAPAGHADRYAAVLIVAGVVSWAWGRPSATAAYLRLVTGRRAGGPHPADRGRRRGAVATGTRRAARGGWPGDRAGGAPSPLDLAAAGVLLVLGRERLLLAALSPLAAGAAALPWWEPGPVLRAGLPLLALLATLAVTARVLAGRGSAVPARCLSAAPGRAHARRSRYGLFGLAAAVLVLLEGRRHPYAVIALTLSMGPAEWLLVPLPRLVGRRAAGQRDTSAVPAPLGRRCSAAVCPPTCCCSAAGGPLTGAVPGHAAAARRRPVDRPAPPGVRHGRLRCLAGHRSCGYARGWLLGFGDLVLDLLAGQRPPHACEFDGYWLDIGRADDYDRANAEFTSRKSLLLREA
ncbi:hypothetical protein SGLAM104S_09454 [Streptomyces glaucescens]